MFDIALIIFAVVSLSFIAANLLYLIAKYKGKKRAERILEAHRMKELEAVHRETYKRANPENSKQFNHRTGSYSASDYPHYQSSYSYYPPANDCRNESSNSDGGSSDSHSSSGCD